MIREKIPVLSFNFKKYPEDILAYIYKKYKNEVKNFEIREVFLMDSDLIVKKYVIIADELEDIMEYLKDKPELNFYII